MVPPLRLALLVALTMAAFAANSILNRLALVDGTTGPLAFSAVRCAAGALCLSALTLGQGGAARLRAGLSAAKAAALLAYLLGFSLAYLSLDAGLGALLLFGGVQLTMFAGALLGDEQVTRQRAVGAGVAFAGLAWLLWPAGTDPVPLWSAAAMLIAALGWGLFSLMGRKATDPLGATAAAFVLAMVPLGVLGTVAWDGMDLRGAALAVVSGALTSGLGYALWYRLLPSLAATSAAVAQLMVPPLALIGGAAVLAERPDLATFAASAVVLGGVAIAVLPPRKPGRPG